MRIQDWNPLQAYNKIQNGQKLSNQENKPNERNTVVRGALTSAENGDRLEISQAAQVKNHAVAKAFTPREARIEALRQQVQAGTYDVPAELVARKMLQALTRRF